MIEPTNMGAHEEQAATGLARRKAFSLLISFLLVGTLAALFGAALIAHVQRSALPYAMNDDARQQIYPFFRYHDVRLFPHDYIGGYYLACLPWGYRLLYTLAGWCNFAIGLSKTIPYLGLVVVVACSALSARALAGKAGAWVAAALCLGSGIYLSRMSGGLPRSFAFPFLAAAGTALVYGRLRALACLVPLAAAFYPASAVPSGIALALVLFVLPSASRGDAERYSIKQRALLAGASALVAALVVLPSAQSSRGYGRVITPAMVGQFPEAGPGGRYSSTDRAPSQVPQPAERAANRAGQGELVSIGAHPPAVRITVRCERCSGSVRSRH